MLCTPVFIEGLFSGCGDPDLPHPRGRCGGRGRSNLLPSATPVHLGYEAKVRCIPAAVDCITAVDTAVVSVCFLSFQVGGAGCCTREPAELLLLLWNGKDGCKVYVEGSVSHFYVYYQFDDILTVCTLLNL